MQKQHPKYKIKEGDTIQRITSLFGIEQDIWTRYHNNMCRLEHVIRKNFPSELEEIYLLPELWEKEDDLNQMLSVKELSEKKINQRVSFGYQNTLPMKACWEVLNYGVMLALFDNEKVNTIKYEVSIKWIAKEENEHIIEIDRISNTYINDQEPDLMAEVLAVKTASALYPLELVVTRADGIIGINNFEKIQKRWKNIKQEIRKYYEGETLEKYLQLNDGIIMDSDSDILLRSLKNDWFLHGYFNKIYQTYGEEFSFTNKINAPFIFDSKGIEYTVKQNINNLIDERGRINVEMKGICSDDRSASDLRNRFNFPNEEFGEKETGKYWGKYFIEPKYHTIEAFMVEADLEKNKKKARLTVSKINNRIEKKRML